MAQRRHILQAGPLGLWHDDSGLTLRVTHEDANVKAHPSAEEHRLGPVKIEVSPEGEIALTSEDFKVEVRKSRVVGP